jgi:hypothetical protein
MAAAAGNKCDFSVQPEQILSHETRLNAPQAPCQRMVNNCLQSQPRRVAMQHNLKRGTPYWKQGLATVKLQKSSQ